MPIGLALSGGGFRATLFHLGVVRALKDADVLKDVAHVCSVSGGSILAAHLVLHWEDYLGAGFDARANEILDFCAFDVRNRIVRRYPSLVGRWLASKLVPFGLVSAKGPADLLQRYYHRLYGDATLEQLRNLPGKPRPAVHLLTTNVTTGTLCSFGGDGFVSEAAVSTGRAPQAEVRIPAATPTISFAVAASSAFPGMFSPLRLTADELGKFDAPLQPSEQFITDGGVYDNLGVRKFMNSPETLGRLDRIYVSNASLELKTTGGREHVGMMKTALRAADLLGHRVYQLEAASMERVSAGGPTGKFVPINVRDVIPRSEEPDALHENTQEWMRWIRTDLDRFSPFEMHCLIRHGWTVARQALRSSGVAAGPAPAWQPVPAAAVPEKPVSQVTLLSKSVGRRLRLFGADDPVSWVHAVLFLLIVSLAVPGTYAWEKLRRPLAIRALEGSVRGHAAKHQHRLAVEISYRRSADGKAFSRDAEAGDAKTPSSYVSLSTLDSLLRDDAQLEHRALAAHQGILNGVLNAEDFDRDAAAWHSARNPHVLRAEPSLWAVSIVSRLLQTRDLSVPQRAELRASLDRILKGLKAFSRDGGVWLLVAEQKEPLASPYAAALAIEAFLEHRKAWRAQEFLAYDGKLLGETCRRLAQDWKVQDGVGGWSVPGLDGKIAVSPGLSMLIYSALMRAEEADPALSVLTPPMTADIARRVERMRGANDIDFVEHRTFAVTDLADGKPRPVPEIKLFYQWLPWGIECTNEWLRRLRRLKGDEREILRTLETMERLLRDPFVATLALTDTHITENLAEMHLILGRVLGDR